VKSRTGDTGRRPKAALFDQCTKKGAQIRNYHVLIKMAPKDKMAPGEADATGAASVVKY